VIVDGPRDAWVGGQYTLDVSFARQYHCTFELSAEGPPPVAGVPFTCTPELPTSPGGFVSSVHPIYDWDSGMPCAVGSDSGEFPSCPFGGYRIHLLSDPSAERVEVRLAVGGVVLLEQASPLEYETFQPNGPECGPTCRSASVRMNLAVP